MKMSSLTIAGGLFLSLITLPSFAQDDLMNLLSDSSTTKEPVIATFKSSRIINAHTVETVRKGDLDFRVGHRFGNMGKKSGGGPHTLYGFDSSDDINIAFEYGITNDLTVGFSRSKMNEALQGSLKYRLLHQTTDNSTPVSITLFSSNVLLAERNGDGRYDKYTNRLSYVTQAIIARKFSPGLSLEIIPTTIHRNWVESNSDENTNFALGFGGRVKLTKRSALVADIFYTFSNFRQNSKDVYLMPPLSLGYEIETGGHVFTLMFSNGKGLLENSYLVNTTDSWGRGGFKFSFIISRTFTVAH